MKGAILACLIVCCLAVDATRVADDVNEQQHERRVLLRRQQDERSRLLRAQQRVRRSLLRLEDRKRRSVLRQVQDFGVPDEVEHEVMNELRSYHEQQLKRVRDLERELRHTTRMQMRLQRKALRAAQITEPIQQRVNDPEIWDI